MTTTLPEITIEGRTDAQPVNAADWFCEGFVAGWKDPDATVEPPAPLREDLLSAYYEGVAVGKQTRNGIDAQYAGPAVEQGRLGDETFEHLEREWKEAWSHFINHRHEPHTEPPEIRIMPGPGVR